MFSRTVGEVAGKFPQYVSADAPLAEASRAMAFGLRGCVFVRENDLTVGMITETSLLRSLLKHPSPDHGAALAMLSPAPGVPAAMAVPHACRVLEEKGVKHLAVHDVVGMMVGVVSDLDLAGALGLDFLMENAACQTLMTKTVLAGSSGMTARSVAGVMLERGVDCMLTIKDGRPTGIVTEWDLAVKSASLPGGLDVSVAEYLTSPVSSVPLGGMVYKVILYLRKNNIRHVPVVDEAGLLRGMLTISEILRRAAALPQSPSGRGLGNRQETR